MQGNLWNEPELVDIQDITIFYGQRQFGIGFFVHKTLIPTIKDLKDVSRMRF